MIIEPKITNRIEAASLAIKLLALTIIALAVCWLATRYLKGRYIINPSSSMPIGIYRIIHQQPKRGSIVGACLPESFATLARERNYLGAGECWPSGERPVMKYVRAVEGDTVVVKPDGVWINGESVANTKLLDADAQGRRG